MCVVKSRFTRNVTVSVTVAVKVHHCANGEGPSDGVRDLFRLSEEGHIIEKHVSICVADRDIYGQIKMCEIGTYTLTTIQLKMRTSNYHG